MSLRVRLILFVTISFFAATPAISGIIWTTSATASGGDLNAMLPGDTLTLDITVTVDDVPLGVSGRISGYPVSVISLVPEASTLPDSLFPEVCFPAIGCIGGMPNQLPSGDPIEIVGPGGIGEIPLFEGVNVTPGATVAPVTEPQFQIVMSAIAPGTATLLIGTFAAYGDGYTGTVDSNASNSSVTITVIPEPGTAFLLGLGLVGLARRTRGA